VNGALLDDTGLLVVGLYLCSLLLIGWFANRAQTEHSARDYYLAGGSLGAFSLFFTLYATQYSGNTLLAAPGKAYRSGLDGLAIVMAIMLVVLVYSTFAPRLNRLAAQHRFITVADFLRWRYPDSRQLLLLVNLVLVLTLTTYALGNFKAVGLLVEGVTGGTVSFPVGVALMALIMAAYESMGGMRGVVWTDIVQGLMLMLGCLAIFAAVYAVSDATSVTHPAGLRDALRTYVGTHLVPMNFASLVLLIGVGAAVYPQAIQRIFAARNPASLRRSYRLMFWMPLVTTLPMLLVGMSVAEWLPGLSLVESERVVVYAIQRVVDSFPLMAWLLILCLAAALAAIMSTIDSALLTLGSIVTRDVFGKSLASRGEAAGLRASRSISWLLMAVMAVLAIYLPQSIWALMVFKFELLVQVAPAIILGVRNPQMPSLPVLVGLLAGVAVAIVLKLFVSEGAEPLGLHSGTWGLLANLLLVAGLWRRAAHVA
jgi:Na+/proline symporter